MRRQKGISPEQLELPGFTDLHLSGSILAGVDEVGRGALFGPVVAAAVILPEETLKTLSTAGVTDSKLLSPSNDKCWQLKFVKWPLIVR